MRSMQCTAYLKANNGHAVCDKERDRDNLELHVCGILFSILSVFLFLFFRFSPSKHSSIDLRLSLVRTQNNNKNISLDYYLYFTRNPKIILCARNFFSENSANCNKKKRNSVTFYFCMNFFQLFLHK